MNLNEQVAALLTRRKGRWVLWSDIARVGGACGWRTRISQCRTRMGMVIDNRQRHIKTRQGVRTISEYRAL